ncbi:MAG: hypothetical protein MUD10_02940, partial [Candidatus Pacebacteria bacterium]|nr:hypothetical protein [Candidatus Paceibacterota bacterium]
TFVPASNDRTFVFSQLSKNIENACIKARRHGLCSKRFCFFIKTQQFNYRGCQIDLERQTANPNEIVNLASNRFDEVFKKGELYRATGVTLMELSEQKTDQLDLFGKAVKNEKFSRIFEQVDKTAEKFGKHAVFLGSSFTALTQKSPKEGRNCKSEREQNPFKGERGRLRIGIPRLGSVG